MYADPLSIRITLNEEEQAFAEADAAALGMSMGEYLRMAFVEQARIELGESSVCMTTFH